MGGRIRENKEVRKRGRIAITVLISLKRGWAGDNDNTAYGAAILKMAKLTGSRNSQVLALQKLNRRFMPSNVSIIYVEYLKISLTWMT
jgi:hypothetical protein